MSATSPIVKETFQLTWSAGSLGLPVGAHFDLDELRRQYKAAKIGLSSHTVPLPRHGDDFPDSSGVGVDDLSQGYLRRTVVKPASCAGHK